MITPPGRGRLGDRRTGGRRAVRQVCPVSQWFARYQSVTAVPGSGACRVSAPPCPVRCRSRGAGGRVHRPEHISYKNNRIKQYHKLDQALRTEMTINDTREFGIGKRLHNLPALADIGFQANRRLLHAQRLSHDPVDGPAPSPPSPARSPPQPAPAFPGYGSVTCAHTPCSPPCAPSSSCLTVSPTATCPPHRAIPRQDLRGHHQRADEL